MKEDDDFSSEQEKLRHQRMLQGLNGNPAVVGGAHATESEVIRDGLRALLARDRAVEHWLPGQVAPAYDALQADPSRAISVDDVKTPLAAEHEAAIAKTR